MLSLASTLLYILFVLAAIVLVVVVLLQEGRGGGLTDALGTSGQQTFGVGASGINRFTGITAAVFLGSALLIHFVNRQTTSVFGDEAPIPAESSPFPGAGGDGSGGAPGGSPGAPPGAPSGGTSGGQPPAGPPAPPSDGGQPK